MNLRSRKLRSCSKGDLRRDRLSEMPDEVIVHILSFLPTLDAVRTVLLRCFGSLWTLVPNLNFDIDTGRHYKFVREALLLYKTPSIDKFQLTLSYQGFEEMSIDENIYTCMRFALDRHAKEIIFRYISDLDFFWTDFLPEFVSQSLVTLELVGCRIYLPFEVKFGSLKKLTLGDVVIDEEAVQQIIFGCPSLQELRIVSPFKIKTLSFNAPNIDKLSLVITKYDPSHFDPPKIFPSRLDLPKLKSLDLELEDIPEVIDVSSVRHLYLKRFTNLMDEDERLLFSPCFEKFGGAEVLQVSRYAEMFLHSVEELNLLQIRWKRVVLEVPRFCKYCLEGISDLLRGLQQLEELIIYTTLTRAEELEFVKRVSTFRRASTSASVVFA